MIEQAKNISYCKIKQQFVAILSFIFLFHFNTYSQEEKSVKVLIVGNSFTYFWNMPQLVDAMAKDQGVPLLVRQSTVGGSNLKQHWNEEKGTRTQKLLSKKKMGLYNSRRP